MFHVRSWAFGLGLALLLGAVATVAPPDKAKAKGKGGLAASLDQLTRLLPPDPDNKLKLTDDEQKQITKIQDEYADKSKDSLTALKDTYTQNADAIKKARKDKDKAALKQAMAPVREKAQDFVKVRSEYDAKLRDVLTDDQKKTLDELKAENAPKGPLANLLGKGKKKKNG